MKDLMGIMKQAQAMQEKMQAVQADLDRLEVQGASGGGMIGVTMTAKASSRRSPSIPRS
jgi:DNA-binding protein YbaB